MRRLRKRPPADRLATEKRRATNSAGRLVYLALLAAFATSALDYLFGDFVFLRADGLVLSERAVIAATYTARVEKVEVREGQRIEPGEVLLRLQSSEMLDRLADLSTRRAELAAKMADFKVRAETVAELLPLARRRESESEKVLRQVDGLAGSGLVTSVKHDEALRLSFDAREARVRLSALDRALKDELATLEAARRDAERALADLDGHYGGGIVRAPVGGAIGASVPAPGAVFRPGESMLAIHAGERYVLAYLPRRYLFPIAPGMKVTVTGGRREARGTIAEILPVTDALPKEFQNTFKPRDRSQLAKVRFEEEAPFPLQAKVTLTRSLF